MCFVHVRVESKYTPSSLNSWTHSTIPCSVSRTVWLYWLQLPSNSLVLLKLIFISFFWAHRLTECRKLGMCEGEVAEAKISDMVVSSTYLWVGHCGAKSSSATTKGHWPQKWAQNHLVIDIRQGNVSLLTLIYCGQSLDWHTGMADEWF